MGDIADERSRHRSRRGNKKAASRKTGGFF
jgi:hypothetical protein